MTEEEVMCEATRVAQAAADLFVNGETLRRARFQVALSEAQSEAVMTAAELLGLKRSLRAAPIMCRLETAHGVLSGPVTSINLLRVEPSGMCRAIVKFKGHS